MLNRFSKSKTNLYFDLLGQVNISMVITYLCLSSILCYLTYSNSDFVAFLEICSDVVN